MIYSGVYIGDKLECMPNTLFVSDLDVGEKVLKSGIVLQADRIRGNGNFVKCRWAKVQAVHPDIKGIEVGDWVLLRHGHWSTSLRLCTKDAEVKYWFISPKSYRTGLLGISKQKPTDVN